MAEMIHYDLGAVRKLAKQFPEVTREETEAVMHLVVKRLEALVIEKTPTGISGDGGLRGSIFGEVTPIGKTVTGTVGTPLEYGQVVEMGRRPGKAMPPVEPIALWVRRQLRTKDRRNKKGKILETGGRLLTEEQSRSVGFVVARKIAIEGFEGKHMFEKSWKEIEPWAQKQLMGIADRVIKRVGAA